uniref:RING-type domain-containing protein n=1 Tax=Strigamia maritima TaxID=126957 RepID=T1J9K2_STRMM
MVKVFVNEGNLKVQIGTFLEIQTKYPLGPLIVFKALFLSTLPSIDGALPTIRRRRLRCRTRLRKHGSASSYHKFKMTNPTTDLYEKFLHEVTIVKKYVKNRSDEEILAYLEAHFGDSNRVETVVKELCRDDENFVFPAIETENTQENDKICLIDLTEDDDSCFLERKSLENPQPSTSALSVESSVDKQIEILKEMFPDGDPEFFFNFVQENYSNTELVQETVNSWLENKSYKKLEQAKRDSIKRKFAERNFTVEEFLEMFPDPEKYFNNTERAVSGNYKKHIYVYAINNFKNISTDHRVEYGPSEKIEMPQPMDELFYKELQYLELADDIKDYQKKKKDEKKRKVDDARCAGTLMTCECCFEDELLLEDMLPCVDDHLFCKDCIRRQAEINIGANNLHFPCFNGYCKKHFSMKVLQSCLKANIFSIVLRKVQEEEIRRAEIPDLETCSFCSFCAIMPDPNDKVFKCLNPECLKESCRLCKELNHVPLRCNEIENKTEVDMRTFIENKMTDAFLRTCPNCKRRFFKDYGCNKMTCTCGQLMCYVCRKPIKDYEHFDKIINGKSDKCQLYSNDREMERVELQKTVVEAREEYIKKHPESANIELRYDFTKHIASNNNSNNNRQKDFYYDYEQMMVHVRRHQTEIEERKKGVMYGCLSPGEKAIENLSRLCDQHDRNGRIAVRAQQLRLQFPRLQNWPNMPEIDAQRNRMVQRLRNIAPKNVFPPPDPVLPPNTTADAALAAKRRPTNPRVTTLSKRGRRNRGLGFPNYIDVAADPVKRTATARPATPIQSTVAAWIHPVPARPATAATATTTLNAVPRQMRIRPPSNICLDPWVLPGHEFFDSMTSDVNDVMLKRTAQLESDLGRLRNDCNFVFLPPTIRETLSDASVEQPLTTTVKSAQNGFFKKPKPATIFNTPVQNFPIFSAKLIGGKEHQSTQRQNAMAAAELDGAAVTTGNKNEVSELKDIEIEKPSESFVNQQKEMFLFWSKKQHRPVTLLSTDYSSTSESDSDSSSDSDN